MLSFLFKPGPIIRAGLSPHRIGSCQARIEPKQQASCWARGSHAYWPSISAPMDIAPGYYKPLSMSRSTHIDGCEASDTFHLKLHCSNLSDCEHRYNRSRHPANCRRRHYRWWFTASGMTFMLESVRPLHILIVIETEHGIPIYCNENYPAGRIQI